MPLRPAVLLASLLLATPALAGSAKPGPEPGHHEIRLRLDPQGSGLQGSDRYTTAFAAKLRFSLREGIELDAVRCGETDLLKRLRPDRKATEAGHWELRVPRACAGDGGELVLDFEFHGQIHDEPTSEPSLHFVTGQRSTGIISEQGAFLSGGTGFHPGFGGMARFDLVVDVPDDWAVASQGHVVEPKEEPESGRKLFAFESGLPSDGLALSAGAYTVSERRHGDTLVRTFFFEDDADKAELFLDAVTSYIDRFEEMLGPYPHSKFDVVENFFTTGYGFPGYALLGSRVIAMGPRALRPGYVDHEVAHCWWGNGVHVSREGGNWCEGLTTYVANYMAAEGKDAEAAVAYRRKVAQRYAIDVAAESDFPPVDFSWKTGDTAASIGYGKVSLVFHQLRRELGDELFWQGLRELVSRRLGKQASWADIRTTFEEVAGVELGTFFSQWLERAGLPRLGLADVEEGGGRVTGLLTQSGETYNLRPEIRVHLQDGRDVSARVRVTGDATAFAIDVPSPVATVEIDPDWHLPRRLETEELPQSLSRTLDAERQGHGLIIAYPMAPFEANEAVKARAEAYKKLAQSAAEQHGGTALPALAVAKAEWNASSLLLLGGADENPLVNEMVGELLDAGFDVTGEGFRAGSRRWTEDDDSLLVTVAHPDRAGASVSVWIPNGDDALQTGRFLFYYGWDSWVVLRGGRAMERHTAWPEGNPWRVELAPPAPPASTADRLRASVEKLERPELEGRDAATTASRRTAAEVAAAMEEAGLEPWDPRGFQQVFFWFLRDLPRQAKIFRELPDRTSLAFDCTPAAYWLPVPSNLMAAGGSVELRDPAVVEPILIPIPEGLVYTGTLEKPAFRGLDLRGAAAVLIDDTPLPARDQPEARADHVRDRTRRYMELLSEVRRQEGETLLIIRPQDEPPFFPALTTYASLDGERDPQLAAAASAGGPRGLKRAVSARHAAAPAPTAPVRLAFAGLELLEAMKTDGRFVPGARWWQGLYVDLRLRTETQRIFDRNLIGMTTAMRRLSEGIILVGAHHDGRGLFPDGRVRPGAVENAAGTAVMLELARRLAADPPPLTVGFVSFGASEWGLVGSRSLAETWPGHWPVRALVNIDGVGQRGARLQVLGEGHEPRLAETIRSAAAEAGIAVGERLAGSATDRDDIDAAGHGPWVSKGVPAVSVSQSDTRKPGDSGGEIEDLDFEALAQLVDALEAAIRDLATGGGA